MNTLFRNAKLLGTYCIIASVMLLSSCVAKRKYYEARTAAEHERAQNVALQERLNMMADTVNMLQGKVGALGDVNQSTSTELNMSKDQLNAERQRLAQLQAYVDKQQQNTEALRKKISDALIGFNSSDLTVSMKNGRVYVSMQESLLFPSGSAMVNPKGKDALAKLAGVLNTNPDININIEGHTDSVPIHTKMFPDNWALSTARAVSIAHVLMDKYSVTPQRLTASGRSQYDPVADNGTLQGRALNRRTEIILEPKLDELAQLMGNSMSPGGSGNR